MQEMLKDYIKRKEAGRGFISIENSLSLFQRT